MPANPSRRSIFAMGIAVTLLGVSGHLPGSISSHRTHASAKSSVAARKYAFAPALIEVQQDDLVKITRTPATSRTALRSTSIASPSASVPDRRSCSSSEPTSRDGFPSTAA